MPQIGDVIKSFFSGIGGSAGIAAVGLVCTQSVDSGTRFIGYLLLLSIVVLVLNWAGVFGWFGLGQHSIRRRRG